MPVLAWILFISLVLAVVAAIIVSFLPAIVERFYNKVVSPTGKVAQSVPDLHRHLVVADLHADSLLWNRDLLKRHNFGHIDVPRLVSGNVALQVFAVVTKIPKGMNFGSNPSDSDMITLLSIVQAWPPRTWGSLLQRALYQAYKLERFASRSHGQLVRIRSVGDLDDFLSRRGSAPEIVGALLALEGVQALEGNLANLDLLYDAGFRLIGLTHFFDNEAAGSAHGIDKGGLTPWGRELVQQIQSKNMIVDLAHSSPRTISDVLDLATKPVIVSHTGLCGTCEGPRNLTDDQVRGIAAAGGIIGIAMFEETVCGTEIDDTARAIRYGVDLVGEDHFAVGSDFDGAVTTPIDASGMALLTAALVKQGLSEGAIAKIMGGNALRVFHNLLPRQ